MYEAPSASLMMRELAIATTHKNISTVPVIPVDSATVNDTNNG